MLLACAIVELVALAVGVVLWRRQLAAWAAERASLKAKIVEHEELVVFAVGRLQATRAFLGLHGVPPPVITDSWPKKDGTYAFRVQCGCLRCRAHWAADIARRALIQAAQGRA